MKRSKLFYEIIDTVEIEKKCELFLFINSRIFIKNNKTLLTKKYFLNVNLNNFDFLQKKYQTYK